MPIEKLTKREALEKCIEMWNWLADNPDCDKYDFLSTWKGLRSHPLNSCYCCQYAWQKANEMGLVDDDNLRVDRTICGFCPIDDWARIPEACACESDQNSYALWEENKGWKSEDQSNEENRIEDIRLGAKNIARLAEASLDTSEIAERNISVCFREDKNKKVYGISISVNGRSVFYDDIDCLGDYPSKSFSGRVLQSVYGDYIDDNSVFPFTLDEIRVIKNTIDEAAIKYGWEVQA